MRREGMGGISSSAEIYVLCSIARRFCGFVATAEYKKGCSARPRNSRRRPQPTARQPRRKRACKNYLSRSNATTNGSFVTRYGLVRDIDDDRDRDDDYDRGRT
jgi:hypothetical protein